MRIVKIGANQPSFHSVSVREHGLSLVVSKKTNPADKSKERSTNSAGKSLLSYIVSFVLGGNKSTSLQRALPGWMFQVVINLAGQQRTIERDCAVQDPLWIDGVAFSLKKFREWMSNNLFPDAGGRKFLTPRALVSIFKALLTFLWVPQQRSSAA